MSELLVDRTAVITGAASGNGRAMARTFAENGADIVVADIREEPRQGGTPTHKLIEDEYDVRATFVECDVSDKSDLEDAMDAADAFGGVDIMVNNAGIFRGEDLLSVTEDEFDQMMDINVKGVFFGTQVAAERMIDNGGGSIINLSSVAGLEGGGDYRRYRRKPTTLVVG